MSIDIKNSFTYHKPSEATVAKMEEIRKVIYKAAHLIQSSVPDSPEATLAIRHLEDARMRANQALSLYPDE